MEGKSLKKKNNTVNLNKQMLLKKEGGREIKIRLNPEGRVDWVTVL